MNLKRYDEGFAAPKPRTPLRNRKRSRRAARGGYVLDALIPQRVRVAVARRSGGRCEARLEGCLGDAHHMHHRKMRSQGGPHTALNLLDCCANCHREIHANPARSYAAGLLIASTDEIVALA